MDSDFLAFAGVAALVTIAPAADFALVSRRALSAGAGPAITTALGICSGVLVWGALSALGIAALVAASDGAYALLRLAGAAYLVLLGIQALLRARRLLDEAEPEDARGERHRRSAFGQGLLTNLLNPKVGLFYAAVLPGFVSPRDPVLLVSMLFAAAHAGMGLAWYSFSAWALSRGRRLFAPSRARAALEAVTAVVLIGLGLRVAAEHR